MGDGKTTVIAPLLALVLADGQSLVCACMPSALLEMSRAVLARLDETNMFPGVYVYVYIYIIQVYNIYFQVYIYIHLHIYIYNHALSRCLFSLCPTLFQAETRCFSSPVAPKAVMTFKFGRSSHADQALYDKLEALRGNVRCFLGDPLGKVTTMGSIANLRGRWRYTSVSSQQLNEYPFAKMLAPRLPS